MRDPVVFLPGMGCSAALWEQVVPRLTPAVGSSGVEYGDLGRDSLEGEVAALLETLPDRFALVGLSLGGIVAMALVRSAPHRISRLCLMSTNPHAPTHAQRTTWAAQRRALADGRSARDLQRELLPVLLSAAHRTDALERHVLEMADAVGEANLDRQLSAQQTRIDERPWLPAVDVPTLVLAARDDALCPVSRHEELHALIPDSELRVVQNSGHLSPLEAPGQVAEALSEWLARPAIQRRRPSAPG